MYYNKYLAKCARGHHIFMTNSITYNHIFTMNINALNHISMTNTM